MIHVCVECGVTNSCECGACGGSIRVAPSPRDALDVERLARALEAAISGQHVVPFALRSEFGLPPIWEPLAEAIAREYAAQSKEPTE